MFWFDASVPIREDGHGLGFPQITHERGPMTRQVRSVALAWGGEAAWDALLASVSPACRARFSQPIGFYEWVESPLALELHQAWARLRGWDDMSERGEYAAWDILGGVQHWLLRLASTVLFLQNAPRIYKYYYRGGQMTLVHLEQGMARLEFRASGYPDSWFRDALPSWMKVGMALTGAKGVSVEYVPPDEAEPLLHRFEVLWQS